MADELMRIRVYEDDAEMRIIYEAYVGAREKSRLVRGKARRGLEGEFIRRLLVAGYERTYGLFPAPARAQITPGDQVAASAESHTSCDTNAADIIIKVADSPITGNNDTRQPPVALPGEGQPSSLDFARLLGGGNTVVGRTSPTDLS